jgi:hypothetical protein
MGQRAGIAEHSAHDQDVSLQSMIFGCKEM